MRGVTNSPGWVRYSVQQHDNEYAAVPVTPHIRTCLIGRMVRAFDPSGLEVNSAESDSAVRYRHGEFESSHGQASSLLVCRWHRLIAASTSSSAPRSCHDPSRRTVAVYANPSSISRRSGPPDGCNAGTVSTGRTGVRLVSSNASLNHRHITAGKCISVERVRPECRQHAGRRQSDTGGNEPKSSDQQRFSPPEPAGHRCSGAVSVVRQMKTE